MESVKYYCGLLLNLLVPVAAFLLLVSCLPRLVLFFMPFVLAYLVALVANPVVVFLQKKIALKRSHSSVFISVLVLALVILLGYVAGTRIWKTGLGLAAELPGLYNDLVLFFQSFLQDHEEMLLRLSPEMLETLRGLTNNLNQMVTELLTGLASPTVSLAGSAVKSVPYLFINALIFLLSAFGFISAWDDLQNFLKKHTPKAISGYLSYLREDLKKIFGSWLMAQFKIMFVVFAVLYAGLLLLHTSHPFFLALLTAFLDFLPALGVGFIFWPWIAIELLQGEFMLAGGLSVIYLLTQAVRQILQPKIMGDTMGLPPLWTLFFLYIGFRFYGLAGMIFSVPVGMFLLSLYRYGLFNGMIDAGAKLCAEAGKLMAESRKRKPGNGADGVSEEQSSGE